MAQYIDKDASVAEIEKTINKPYPKHDQQCNWEDGYCSGLYKALSIIEDTLEVKEVDLEKEIEEHVEGMPISEFTHDSEVEAHWDWVRKEFRHFFELGLKTQKGK